MEEAGLGKFAVLADKMSESAFAALAVATPLAKTRPSESRDGKAPLKRIDMVGDGVTIRVSVDVNEAHLTRVIRAVTSALVSIC